MTHPLLEEHKQLRESLLDLERMLEGPPPVRDLSSWVASFAERLRRPTEDVTRHFAWEMNTRLFSQIESALPQASAQCSALLAEHAEIDARLTELSSRLTMPSDSAGLHLLMHDVRTVLDRLHRHEEHENQLLLDAVEIDISAQD